MAWGRTEKAGAEMWCSNLRRTIRERQQNRLSSKLHWCTLCPWTTWVWIAQVHLYGDFFFNKDLLCAVLTHFSLVWLFVTPWTVARQSPLSLGFSRQEYWRGLPCLPPGDLPDPGIKPTSPVSQHDIICGWLNSRMQNHFYGGLTMGLEHRGLLVPNPRRNWWTTVYSRN